MSDTHQKDSEKPLLKEQVRMKAGLGDSLDALAKYGKFGILATTIEKAENLDPAKKARKTIFLTEAQNEQERKKLKNRLQMWADLLEQHDAIGTMISVCEEKTEAATQVLAGNVKKALEASASLAQAYYAVDKFLKNTGQDKVRNVNFLNVAKEDVVNIDNPTYADAVHEEFNHNFNRLDLRRAYSLMVIPGYLGNNSVLNHWAEIAHKHKVTMVTDFRHLDNPLDVIDMFMDADHASADAHKSNIIMACNWLVGREAYPEYGVDEALFVSPGAALAGLIYESKGTMAQIGAGNKYGKVRAAAGVAFDIKKSEITQLENLGLVPMVHEFGNVMAFSGKTLYNGDNIGLQSYSVVRVFDWVTKVLIDFLNRRAFENFNTKTKAEIEKQITKFLESIKGSGKLLKGFKINKFEQDPQNPDIVHIDIHLQPFFATRSFLLSMTGTKGDDGNDWSDSVS